MSQEAYNKPVSETLEKTRDSEKERRHYGDNQPHLEAQNQNTADIGKGQDYLKDQTENIDPRSKDLNPEGHWKDAPDKQEGSREETHSHPLWAEEEYGQMTGSGGEVHQMREGQAGLQHPGQFNPDQEKAPWKDPVNQEIRNEQSPENLEKEKPSRDIKFEGNQGSISSDIKKAPTRPMTQEDLAKGDWHEVEPSNKSFQPETI